MAYREDLQGDARRIGALLASGFGLDQIRSEMKLTRRQFFVCLELIRNRAKDSKDVWPKFLAKMEARYRQYEGVRQRAIQSGKLDTALRAIEDMARLDREIVNVGQELGLYERVAQEHKHVIENPTLGMFFEKTYEATAIEITPEDDKPQTDPKRLLT